MKFKVNFPTGYQVIDERNDNLDINVILENGEIFFCTIFTIENIKMLIHNNSLSFFWADNMVILNDLSKDNIKSFIQETLDFGNFENIFFKIGKLKEVEGYNCIFDEIIDFNINPNGLDMCNS